MRVIDLDILVGSTVLATYFWALEVRHAIILLLQIQPRSLLQFHWRTLILVFDLLGSELIGNIFGSGVLILLLLGISHILKINYFWN